MHGLLIGLLVAHGERLWSRTLAPGDPALRGASAGGGGGGNRVAYITLPSISKPPALPAPRVTAPVPPPKLVQPPAPEPVEQTPAQPEPVDTAATTVAQSPARAAADAGTGLDGTGGTGGGTAGEPEWGRAQAAKPGPGGAEESAKSARPNPAIWPSPFDTPPKELRGVSLSVTFWVRVDGRVERYEVEPEIKDRDYAKKFDEVMRAFRFTPARAPDGTRVAGTTKISFTLPGKSSS